MRIKYLLAAVLIALTSPVKAELRVENADGNRFIVVDGEEPEIADAIRKARDRLSAFFARMENPAATMDTFLVKIGVPTPHGTEYIWLQDVRRHDGRVTGRIDNVPRWTRRLREGQSITVPKADIVDWLYVDNGRIKGNLVACAMNRMNPSAESKAIAEKLRMDCDD